MAELTRSVRNDPGQQRLGPGVDAVVPQRREVRLPLQVQDVAALLQRLHHQDAGAQFLGQRQQFVLNAPVHHVVGDLDGVHSTLAHQVHDGGVGIGHHRRHAQHADLPFSLEPLQGGQVSLPVDHVMDLE